MPKSENSKRSKGRQQFGTLQTPKVTPDLNDVNRDEWIETTCQNFVARGQANKEIYRAILECLWPSGHGIPGPIISEIDIREVVDAHKKNKKPETKPYQDPFRRMREMQGEEGLTGIVRRGKSCQLVSLEITPKRPPRVHLNESDWGKILEKYNRKCAVCGRQEPEVEFQQDHKIPRVRQGGNELENWQPLCRECNNFKSTSCRGCNLDCHVCPWAFPEIYAPIRMSIDNIRKLREQARYYKIDPSDYLNKIINDL